MTRANRFSHRDTKRPGEISTSLVRAGAFLVVFAFGFFLQFNIMTVTIFGPPFMRLSDALLFLFTPYLMLVVGIGPTIRYGLPYFFVLFSVVFLTLLLKTAVEQGDVYMTMIFLLTGVFCFYFAMLAAADERYLVYFAIGTLIGLAASLAILFLQAGGNTNLSRIGLGVPLELLSLRNAQLAKIKLGGLWSSGNESGHVYAVATASALYLALRYRKTLIYLIAYASLAASFAYTLNRGGMVAPTIALIYCYVRLGDFLMYIKFGFLLCVAAIALLAILSTSSIPAPDQLGDAISKRFVDDDYASTNIAERIQSNFEGLRIAFENPFGIGAQERYSTMSRRTHGVESIHNGFLSLAYQSGFLASAFFVIAGVYLLLQRRDLSSFYTIMFLFTTTSMLFEELSINQFFIFSVDMTIATAWVSYATRLRALHKNRRPLTLLRGAGTKRNERQIR